MTPDEERQAASGKRLKSLYSHVVFRESGPDWFCNRCNASGWEALTTSECDAPNRWPGR